jgi:hypothetical protein
MLCWEKKKYPLIESILSTTAFNPSNLKSHIKNRHKANEAPGCFSDVSTITHSTVTVSSKGNIGQNSMLNYQQNPADIPTSFIALSYLYQFFNDANVAIAQSNNENLTRFIEYLLENATHLRKKKADCFFPNTSI